MNPLNKLFFYCQECGDRTEHARTWYWEHHPTNVCEDCYEELVKNFLESKKLEETK